MSAMFFGTAVVSLGLGAMTRWFGTEAALVAGSLGAMAAGFAAQVGPLAALGAEAAAARRPGDWPGDWPGD